MEIPIPIYDAPAGADAGDGSARTGGITVNKFFKYAQVSLKLRLLAGENGLAGLVTEKTLNRPALALTGYFKHFAHQRLQLFGGGEISYLLDLSKEQQREVLREIVMRGIPGILLCSDSPVPEVLLEIAEAQNVPVLCSELPSRELFPEATILLEQLFAPRTTVHATLVDIRGVGVLVMGAAGVGKSECALALIERGHSLVADDFVIVELWGDRTLVGRPKHLPGFMECRGVGLIDVKAIYGVRAVLVQKQIDLVVTLQPWDDSKSAELLANEERVGLDQMSYEIHKQSVPQFVLNVRPGRDMARLVEVCAMIHALRKTGYDCAQEFNKQLIAYMRKQKEPDFPLNARV